jgi:hypothetical protein
MVPVTNFVDQPLLGRTIKIGSHQLMFWCRRRGSNPHDPKVTGF